MLSIIGYILSVLTANFTAAQFITFGPFTLAIGTLFFGVTFTLRDRIHTTLGRATVYKVIGATILLGTLQSIFLGVDSRIIVASAIAMALAESADTEVFHSLARRSWQVRVLRSNLVSIPLDTVVFTLVAFLGILPPAVLVSVIVTDILAKFLTSSIIVLYRAPRMPAKAAVSPVAR